MNDQHQDTISYYNQNAASFAESTLEVDVAHLYQDFFKALPKGGRILDAGCGSGRDAKHFKFLGYEVDAFDASEELCKIATQISGVEVTCSGFLDFKGSPLQYDGIWACASLLHVEHHLVLPCLKNLTEQLKPGGIMYASFKTKVDQKNAGQRHFCDMTVDALLELLKSLHAISLKKAWETSDSRSDRSDQWINVLLENTKKESN